MSITPMITYEFREPYIHPVEHAREASVVKIDANILFRAAIAAEAKAMTFANAGDERMARLHKELSITRRLITERLRKSVSCSHQSL